jgi:hypothetical protein
MRRRLVRALLAAVLLLPLPAAGQGRTVSFSAQVIEASNPARPGQSDVESALLSELKRTFQFTQYKNLGTVNGTAGVGQTWGTALPRAPLRLEATPKSADAGTIAVEVKLLRDGAPVVSSTLRLAPGGKVLVGGPTSPSGRIIVVLTGR